MRKAARHWIGSVGFTAALVLLIGFAVADVNFLFVVLLLAVVVGAVAAINRMFPRSRFFSLALANFLAIYACFFIFFVETNFQPVTYGVPFAAFVLPIFAFLLGVWWRRDSIRKIVASRDLREERHFGRIFLWLVPMFVVGSLTFAIPGRNLGETTIDVLLVAAMALIGVIVLAVSRNVASFLIDTGLLFEEFFERIAGLVIPAFAFFTFYSLTVIVFAAVYRILDRFSAAGHFMVDGAVREISFADSLYFSIVTLSTVGYGDITPASDAVRVISSFQIVCGVLLLLFGFNELFTYSRERRDKSRRASPSGATRKGAKGSKPDVR